MKTKRIVPIIISFLITVIASCSLFFFIRIYTTHKTYKTFEFDEKVEYKNGIIIAENTAYLYNEYGGRVYESELSSMPLLQYSDLNEEYPFFRFDSKYYGAYEQDLTFNGGNDSIRFLHKSNGILYLFNTDDRTFKAIHPDIDFHSASTDGTYLLEITKNKFNFYKRLNYSYDLSPPVSMLYDSDNITFINWINDRYILIKSDTKKGVLYSIADAETGETAPCMSIDDNYADYQKELISNKYFVKQLNNNIIIFDIFKQDEIKFPKIIFNSAKILKVSHDATYLVANIDEKIKIISNNGKAVSISEFADGEYVNSEFLEDNILLLTIKKDGKETSSIHKMLF
jgi:hypothetical protein